VSLRGAILGFLELEPVSGYTLRLRFDGSIASFWSVTQSQIYRELKDLERDGLVVARVEKGSGKPDSRVYSVTPEGREALHQWLSEPLEPMQLRHPLLLKFVFAANVEPEKLDALLAHYAEGLEATRVEYQARASNPQIFSLARSKREADLWSLSLEHGLSWCDMELAWLTKARAKLKRSRR
jgi:DNA-binding PadR family transcriptional regulator